ncbi:transporter [Salmonella enterica subsp. enterica]|uniref:Transporter n=1 Tax=Salmonella enterica I TaxID=59201 RepID=A0A379X3T0_SALET|nr:transporter [Salmonella enterica subsp. enterica]
MPPDNELMNELKKELGLVQGVILLTTSLLGTGVFALPELAALAAGDISLWAWPLLIILIFPIAIVFAVLGRHFPHRWRRSAFCRDGIWPASCNE